MKIIHNTNSKTFTSLVFATALILIPAISFADNDKDKDKKDDKRAKVEVSASVKNEWNGWHWPWNNGNGNKYGIFKNWPWRHATTTNPKPVDTVAPVINSFTVSPRAQKAEIRWSTNEKTRGVVFYGTSTPVVVKTSATSTGALTSSVSSSNSIAVVDEVGHRTNASLTLKKLSATTTYHAVLAVRDQSGNVTISNVVTFQTLGTTTPADTKSPVISNIMTTIKSAAVLGVSWMTNEPATSKVFYGTSTVDINSASTRSESSTTLKTNHSIDVPILSTSTPERFIIQSVDASGNIRTSGEYSVFLPL